MTTEQELTELLDAQRMIQTDEFQKYIVKPMREYQATLKDAYQCDTLKELWNVKGRKQGSEEFFNVLKGIVEDIKIKSIEISDKE